MKTSVFAVATLAFALVQNPALSEQSPWRVSYPIDGAVVGALVGGSLLISQIEVDTKHRWRSELIWGDEWVRGRYSRSAAQASDVLGLLTFASPIAMVVGQGIDKSLAHRGVVYAETLSASWLLNTTAKYVVQRPRPYAYSTDPNIVTMTAQQRRISHLSFYSGHASSSFTAAVAGSYLYAAQSSDETSRALFWGFELALASATANLRVRAGKHFFSDIIMGAIVGAGMGLAIPRLHLDPPSAYRPTTSEYATMAAGVAVGSASAWLIPFSDEIAEDLSSGPLLITPTPMPGGVALTASGLF